MKLLIKITLALAIISAPFVASTALDTTSDDIFTGHVIEHTVITDEVLASLEPVDGFELDDCTNETCETDRDQTMAQGHSVCSHTAIAEKTKQLARIAIAQAKENCRNNGCAEALICRIEREVVQGGYSCGVTVWVTYCCADCES